MTAPLPARQLPDRVLDEGRAVAASYAGQDRLDPTRPALATLIAEAIALAERRGELRVIEARRADRDALLDLLGAVAGYTRGDRTLTEVQQTAARAQRHVDRTGRGQ